MLTAAMSVRVNRRGPKTHTEWKVWQVQVLQKTYTWQKNRKQLHIAAIAAVIGKTKSAVVGYVNNHIYYEAVLCRHAPKCKKTGEHSCWYTYPDTVGVSVRQQEPHWECSEERRNYLNIDSYRLQGRNVNLSYEESLEVIRKIAQR